MPRKKTSPVAPPPTQEEIGAAVRAQGEAKAARDAAASAYRKGLGTPQEASLFQTWQDASRHYDEVSARARSLLDRQAADVEIRGSW